MENEKIKRYTIISSLLCILLSLVMFYSKKITSSMEILYYPFQLIGNFLRYLSLSSSMGNVISIIIYAAISIMPALVFYRKLKKDHNQNQDVFLLVLSGFLFYLLYNFINPENLYSLIPEEFYGAKDFIVSGKLALSMMFYIILTSYFVLKGLNSLSEDEYEDSKSKILKNMQMILFLFLISYSILIFYFGTFSLLEEISEEFNLYYIIKFLVSVMPNAMSMVIIYVAIKCVKAFEENSHSSKVLDEIRDIFIYSRITVYLSVISSLFVNGTQLLFSTVLGDLNISLDIPFLPLIIAFLGLILSKYFKENNDLFEDNNTII